MSPMRIDSISLRGWLSFGWEPVTLSLGPLTALLGPNGSGKSNVLLALDMLRGVTGDFRQVPQSHGGAFEFVHKKPGGDGLMSLEAVLSGERWPPLRYTLTLRLKDEQLVIEEERVETRDEYQAEGPLQLAVANGGMVLLRTREESAEQEGADPTFGVLRRRVSKWPQTQSILTNLGAAPSIAPWLSDVAEALAGIAVYHHLPFGPFEPARLFQQADQPDRRLLPNGQNLALVLKRLLRDDQVRERLRREMRAVYEQLKNVDIDVRAGHVQLYVEEEGGYTVGASRLSNGTLRWLSLLAILLDPDPPSLLCIEEPELGLHPDLLHRLAELLKEASARGSIVLTTHSPDLISEFSDQPESVVVCERPFDTTELRRLERGPLESWLRDYSLGHAWQSGRIGGRR